MTPLPYHPRHVLPALTVLAWVVGVPVVVLISAGLPYTGGGAGSSPSAGPGALVPPRQGGPATLSGEKAAGARTLTALGSKMPLARPCLTPRRGENMKGTPGKSAAPGLKIVPPAASIGPGSGNNRPAALETIGASAPPASTGRSLWPRHKQPAHSWLGGGLDGDGLSPSRETRSGARGLNARTNDDDVAALLRAGGPGGQNAPTGSGIETVEEAGNGTRFPLPRVSPESPSPQVVERRRAPGVATKSLPMRLHTPPSTTARRGPTDDTYSTARLLTAIRRVESGGRDDALGDGGRSRGPLQIQRPLWQEACRFLGVNWRWETESHDYGRSCAVAVAYWVHYGLRTDEERARCWNGGPRGMTRPGTLAYWAKVLAEMERQERP
jgi:hypothetical protein